MIRSLVTLLASLALVFATASLGQVRDTKGNKTFKKEGRQGQKYQPKLITSVNDVTFGVQKDKMQSANKNAEAVRSLLRPAPKSNNRPAPRPTGGATTAR